VTLLLLKNNWIPLYQSSNFIWSLLDYPKFGTMLFGIIAYAVLLYTTGIGAVNISSDVADSVVLFLSEVYSLVIFNDSNISSNASMSIVS